MDCQFPQLRLWVAITSVICGMLFMPYLSIADNQEGKPSTTARYVVDLSRIDSDKDFNAFLDRCSLEERVYLMQSLMGFSDIKLAKHHFGKLKGLKEWNAYADKKRKATVERPLRPKNFNDVPPATVVDAMERAIIPEDLVSPSAIRKELLWNCCNKLRYRFLHKSSVDYHKEALQWVCQEHNMPKTVVETLSSFDLERKFIERYFEEIWDKLNTDQRNDLLGKIEQVNKTTLSNKAGIAAMSGESAVAALGTTVAFSGFAFYTTMTTTMATVACGAGVTLFSVAGSLFAGPVGGIIAGSAVMASWPDSQKVTNFVITTHLIKTRWANRDRVFPSLP